MILLLLYDVITAADGGAERLERQLARTLLSRLMGSQEQTQRVDLSGR